MLQRRLIERLSGIGVRITGSADKRLVDNIHAIFDVDGDALLTLLSEEGIEASSGSTCYQYAGKESHVLKAIGFQIEDLKGSVLFTLSIEHSTEDIEFLANAVESAVKHLRSLKPQGS